MSKIFFINFSLNCVIINTWILLSYTTQCSACEGFVYLPRSLLLTASKLD